MLPFQAVRVRRFSTCSCGSLLTGVFRQPIPMIRPMFISGHCMSWCGHVSSASLQMMRFVFALHWVRMCSIDSVVLHVGQVSLYSKFGMWFHTSPTISAW